MHTLLTTLVLCLAAHVASAQCVSNTPATTAAAPAQRVELIKTAAAETRGPSAIPLTPIASQDKTNTTEHRGRTGTATLLVALALMSGIALRRFSASDQ